MSKHTEGPWFWEGEVLCNKDYIVGGGTHGFNKSNKERIVACVNACEGISTENLTNNLPLKQGLSGLNQRVRDAESQRDSLLDALEGILSAQLLPEYHYKIARSAIAKATGETS